MWESTFSPDNKEIKRGLEGESSYNKSLVQKYKTMKQDIARQADEAVSTYRGICPPASSSKTRRMKENKAKCRRRKLKSPKLFIFIDN